MYVAPPISWLAGVVAAQVLFSTTYAFADKATHDMYVLYSCFSAVLREKTHGTQVVRFDVINSSFDGI